MKYIKENDFFESSDLALISCLFYYNCKIEAIDKSDPSRAIFIIKRSKDLDKLVQGFWMHTLQIEPQAYFNSIKEIKSRIYQRIN